MISTMDDSQEDVLFEKTKAYLMSANKDGMSLYDQLTRLMEMLLDEKRDDVAYDPARFLEMFSLLQQHGLVCGESTATCNETCPVSPQKLQRLLENQSLLERGAPEVHTTIEQPDPYTTITTTTTKPLTAPRYESVAQQNRYWSIVGCGMLEAEAFLLDRSITKLAMQKNLLDVRFVGKIFGTSSNYYVISSRRYVEAGEKVYQETNTMPKPPRKKGVVLLQPEPGFVGSNRFSFWVTSYPSSNWSMLPDITPEQINASRAIKRLFTGRLDAEVVSSPPFPWKESVYLRAQLARIVSGTYISPQGALEEPEEEIPEDDEEDDEASPQVKEARYRPLTVPSKEFAEEEMDVAQFASLDQWVHSEGYIYKNGRQTKVPEKPEPEEEDEEQPPEPVESAEEEEEVEEEEEEEHPLFMPIRGDHLYAVVEIPQPPPQEDEENEDEEEAEEPSETPEVAEEDNSPHKPLFEEDVPDDDVTKMKVAAWTVRMVNSINKAHRVTVVQSLRWPGAIAFAAEGGKRWGSVYFGSGLKKTDFAFTPCPAPPILGECADVLEVVDPTAAMEKLIRRGEDIPEPDSENELEEVEEDEM